eukprot:2722860-Amphidinium_carterae.2
MIVRCYGFIYAKPSAALGFAYSPLRNYLHWHVSWCLSIPFRVTPANMAVKDQATHWPKSHNNVHHTIGGLTSKRWTMMNFSARTSTLCEDTFDK